MANLLQVTLTNGIPTAGNGTVSTIDALMADGGQATLGFKSDVAASNIDATPISIVSILKQCSMMLQNIHAVLPSSLSNQGALKVDGSGLALPVSISGSPTMGLAQGYSSKAQVTSTTAAIAAGGVVGATGSGAVLFAGVAPGAMGIEIVSASMEIDRNAIISGETSYALYFYSAVPPSGIVSGAAWSLPAGDRPLFLGTINLGTPAVIGGSVVWTELNNIHKQIRTTGTGIYAYLVSAGAYTPTAVAITLTLNTKTV